ncbi:response regulator [Candidatus Kaiserbacteria bacterium]|nr:response regulator [Candidatus Kaiserbacteria bacterium]
MSAKKQPRILIIEDNESNHPLFKAAFTAKGFEVVISQNGDGDFITDVLAIKPDIISMDLMLGKPNVDLERDGFDILKLLQEDERTTNIPVFILTSFFAEDKVQKALALGATDFISLPGHAMGTVPNFFLEYLEHPKRYKPVNPLFAAAHT